MNSILSRIIGTILMLLPDDLLKSAVANFINHVEDNIKNDGKTNWEDSAVIPLLEAIKKQLGIVAPGVTTTVVSEDTTGKPA